MPNVLSLFSGAGGFDCGLGAAGYVTLACVDNNHWCALTLRRNGVADRTFEADVGAKKLERYLDQAPAIDLICAGPPCQPFSKSANWYAGSPKGFDDPRATSLDTLMGIIERSKPRAVLIENVPGFARQFGGLDWLRAAFRNVNARAGTHYDLSHAIIDAADYGVPQRRRRLLVVADREGRSFVFPPAITSSNPKTAWDALWNIEQPMSRALRVRGRWAKLLPSIPAGENYLWHTERGGGKRLFGYRTRYWNFLLKLSPTQPSWTLSAQPAQAAGPFHWQNRRLSVREMLRLQSFPTTWSVSGSYVEQLRQLGNAFPPLLAEIIGREIRGQLLDEPWSGDSAYSLWIPSASETAPTITATGVPRKFLNLIDEHPAHPGSGQGPSAIKRAA